MTVTGKAEAPWAELRGLHEANRLAAEYPRVRALLADVPADRHVAAGRLLARVAAAEITEAHPGVTPLRVAITGHGTLPDLVPALAYEFARHGLALVPHTTDFDSYVVELSEPGSGLYAAEPELTLCVLDPRIVLDELPAPWAIDELRAVLDAKLTLLAGLITRHAEQSGGQLVLNTLPLPRTLTAQLIDHRTRAAAAAAWHAANARLLGLVADHPTLTVIDLLPLVGGGIAVEEPRLSRYARAHLSAALLAEYAREVGHLARARTGRTRKVLALDLDNTLWGGVLGDDGADGIEVADSPRGEAFAAFQRVAGQLGAQGVLLAAVSKNDPEPVRAVLRDHPDMSLREHDFARVAAGWRPKPEALVQLAADLNVGVDAIVFADDSPFECGLVRHELPEVAVVALDAEPALHIERLLADGWFDTRDITAEDRARPRRYREELGRQDFLRSADSVADYLSGLEIEVEFAAARPADIPRISQITLRTNQFNLTTHRLQVADVTALLADPDADVLTIRSRDRFGDNGTVGAVFTRRAGTVLHIENFLLSCRVFSRGIEQACLATLLARAQESGITEVLAEYRRSPKNGKVAQFYARSGFTVLAEHEDSARFRHDLAELPAVPTYLRLSA